MYSIMPAPRIIDHKTMILTNDHRFAIVFNNHESKISMVNTIYKSLMTRAQMLQGYVDHVNLMLSEIPSLFKEVEGGQLFPLKSNEREAYFKALCQQFEYNQTVSFPFATKDFCEHIDEIDNQTRNEFIQNVVDSTIPVSDFMKDFNIDKTPFNENDFIFNYANKHKQYSPIKIQENKYSIDNGFYAFIFDRDYAFPDIENIPVKLNFKESKGSNVVFNINMQQYLDKEQVNNFNKLSKMLDFAFNTKDEIKDYLEYHISKNDFSDYEKFKNNILYKLTSKIWEF